MVDSIYRTRSLGAPAEGLKDQYADGRAAKLWEIYVGDTSSRTEYYKTFLFSLLRQNHCSNVLDVACGTGIDSVILVEEGFNVTSVDASDKMLKYALKTRWNRRKEAKFDSWVIEEANWLTLNEDLGLSGHSKNPIGSPPNGFDALICLGNSFAHLPDFSGDLKAIKTALKNFAKSIRPGGIVVIDHRNYDYILDTGNTPTKNIYYSVSNCISKIETSILIKGGQPNLITMDYVIDVSNAGHEYESLALDGHNRFRLSYYPHRLDSFTTLLKEAFDFKCKHTLYGDFKPFGEIENPGFYIHVLEKLQ